MESNCTIKQLLINFIYKFLFIFKAAANGYIVKHIGNNQYEFKVNLKKKKNYTINNFVKTYSSILH
jgi:hypothetical protein